jgi:transposase-like protein
MNSVVPNGSKKRARTTRQRARYTEAQKIQAVAAMLQAGFTGPLSYEAQEAACTVLGAKINHQTLATWLKKYRSTVETTDRSLVAKPLDVPELINSTRDTVIRNLNSAVVKLSAGINDDDAITKAALRDKGVTMGIAVEKILLLAGRDPELDSLTTTLQQECTGTEYNPADLILDMINAVRAAKSLRKPTIDIKNSITR